MMKMQRRTEKRAVKTTQWWKFEEQESREDSAQEEEGALEKTRTNGNRRGRRRQRLHEGHLENRKIDLRRMRKPRGYRKRLGRRGRVFQRVQGWNQGS